MIRITRSSPPEVLLTEGSAKARAHSEDYRLHEAAYDRGMRKFGFDREIYAHNDVKTALIKDQHDKCCFCESKITHIASGDIEHFRPKSAYKQERKNKLMRPGYYWLAYEWSNLFLCCELCNRRWKSNLFPLENPANRALSPDHDIGKERPLFLNPEMDDPEEHLEFVKELVVPRNNSRRGLATVTALGLNRKELQARRRDLYRLIQNLQVVAESALPQRDEAREMLKKASSKSGEYAAMIRCAIRQGFP